MRLRSSSSAAANPGPWRLEGLAQAWDAIAAIAANTSAAGGLVAAASR
jgi:hypothetical protein